MSDVLLVSGFAAFAFAVTSWLAAFAENWWRWSAVVLLGVALGLVVAAWFLHPGGYPPREIPGAFIRVLAMVLN